MAKKKSAPKDFKKAHSLSITKVKKAMDATVTVGSDSYAATVVDVRGSTVYLATPSGSNQWTARKRADDKWYTWGDGVGHRVYLGFAEDYRDPSF